MTKSIKFFAFLFLAVGFWLSRSPLALSYSCEDTCENLGDDQKQTCLSERVTSCQQKVSETNVTKQTLQSAISYFDGKIQLAQAQINQTAYEISQLENEIVSLEGNIANLDIQLDKLGESFSARVRESYIAGQINQMYLFIGSDGFGQFVSRLKYLKITQNHDRKSMLLLEQARANYDTQKTAKETKQQQVLALQADLLGQKKILDSQQREKENLLVITKHDESRYQQLLDDAAAQLRAFSRFVTTQGGASILQNQTKCDGWGCYYNQRDSAWGNIGLGGSSYSTAAYGCLVTSVSMVGSHYGKNFKPGDLAQNSSAFVPGQGYLYHDFNVSGTHVTITNASASQLDSQLASGPVIAGLYSGPDHFIVILKKEGGNYIMHDPFLENGGNRPLTDKYSVGDITSLRLVSFN